MTIRVTNARFESTSSGEFDTVDDAFRYAIASGLEIATSEVSAGSTSSTIVHVAVDLVGKRDAAGGAVAVSTQRLLSGSNA